MKTSMSRFVAVIGVPLFVGLAAIHGQTGGKIDVSRIVDKTAAESVLGEKVKEPRPVNVKGSDGYYSKCNFYGTTPGKTLLVRLYQAAEGNDPQQELNVVLKNTPALKSISGIGDKAFVTAGAASALPADSLMLYVVKGNSILTVGLGGNDNETTALEKAKSIAAKILAQL